MNIRDLLKECEARVSVGDIEGARRVLSELNIAEIPGDSRIPIADLCQRTGLANLRLKVLAASTPDVAKPTPNEIHLRTLRFYLEYGRLYSPAFIKRKLELEGKAFNQFVSWATKAGHIEHIGNGPARKYLLSVAAKKAA